MAHFEFEYSYWYAVQRDGEDERWYGSHDWDMAVIMLNEIHEEAGGGQIAVYSEDTGLLLEVIKYDDVWEAPEYDRPKEYTEAWGIGLWL